MKKRAEELQPGDRIVFWSGDYQQFNGASTQVCSTVKSVETRGRITIIHTVNGSLKPVRSKRWMTLSESESVESAPTAGRQPAQRVNGKSIE